MSIALICPLIGDFPITQTYGAHSKPGGDPDDQKLYLYYRALGLAGHNGIDYGAPNGTPVYAAAAGIVTRAGWDSTGFGNRITIEHDECRSLYGHLSTICVATYQQVIRGQMIGRVGSTGHSSGPHLHFGLYRGGVAIDPQPFFIAVEAKSSSAVCDQPWPSFPVLPRARVIVDELFVRDRPSKGADVIGKLTMGKEVHVIESTTDVAGNPWLRIGFGHWCAYRYADEGQLMEWI